MLKACHLYEFSRRIPKIRAAYKRDLKTLSNFKNGVWWVALVKKEPCTIEHPERAYTSYDNWPKKIGNGPKYEKDYLYAPQGFPDVPFLKCAIENQRFTSAQTFMNITNEDKGVSQAFRRKGEWIDSHGDNIPSEELFHIRIRWDLSDDRIKKDFNKWLTYKAPRPHQPINRRGKNGKIGDGKLMEDLLALGAYRLVMHFDGNIAMARSYCKKIKKIKNDKQLYVRDEEWKNACNRVKAIFKDLSERNIEGKRAMITCGIVGGKSSRMFKFEKSFKLRIDTRFPKKEENQIEIK